MIKNFNKQVLNSRKLLHSSSILRLFCSKPAPPIFPHRIDSYNCAHIDLQNQKVLRTQQFSAKFSQTYTHMIQQNISAIWIEITKKHSHYIPILTDQSNYSFNFHHPRRDGSGIMLSKWMNDKTPSKLPSFCTHYIGVGGLIFNDKNQILLIKQKFAYKQGEKIFWKLPGGLVDPNQGVSNAVVREIYQELNLKTEAVGLLALRELLNFRFGSPDIYFMFLCKLKGESGSEKVDQEQISDFKWFKMSDVMKSSFEKMYTFKSLMKGCERVLEGVEEDQFYDKLKEHVFKIKKNPKAGDSSFFTI